MGRSIEQHVSHFATFNEAIMERESINTIPDVVIDFDENNLFTDVATVIQHDDFQTIPISERILPDHGMNVDISASFTATSPISTGSSMRDIALQALYANKDCDLQGFDRPNKVVTEAKLKFEEYVRKYRPTGWSHYDMDDVSQDLTKLFNRDISHDDEEFRRRQQKIDSVRRKLIFE